MPEITLLDGPHRGRLHPDRCGFTLWLAEPKTTGFSHVYALTDPEALTYTYLGRYSDRARAEPR